MPPQAIKSVFVTGSNPDAVLIGGGNIIHGRAVSLPDYQSAGVRDWAYPSLWLGATLIAAIKDIPVAWNAPGAPFPLNARELRYAAAALEATDYVSLRDAASLAHLGHSAGSAATIVPDTALDIASLWPHAGLENSFRQMLDRKGCRHEGGFVAIHLKSRSLDRPMESVAASIDAFARKYAKTPVLIAIGPCHDDHVTCRRISRFVASPHVTLDDPLDLREIASAIACSDIYIGCSMHGYVTAYAYGVSGVVVANPPLVKFEGLLEQLGRRDSDLASDWSNCFEKAAALMNAPPRADTRLPSEIAARLDRHWAAVAAAFNERKKLTAQRARFLRRAIYFGVERSGWNWAMQGFSEGGS